MNIIKIKWEDMIKIITPLDLVLFAGSDFVSSSIKNLQKQKLTLGDFSHVGIIVTSFVLPHIKELNPNEYYVWESTSSLRLPGFENEPSDIFGKNKLGVQIRNLKEVLDVYKGGVYIGKLKNNPLYSYAFSLKLNEFNKLNEKLEISYYQIKQQETVKHYKFELHEILKDIKDLEKSLESNPPSDSSKSSSGSFDNQELMLEQMIKVSQDFQTHLLNKYSQINHLVFRDFKNTKEYKKILKKLKIIYEVYGDKFYNASMLDLFSALYPILRPLRSLKYSFYRTLAKLFKKKDIEGTPVFCSQFVAIIYNSLGIIDEKIDVKNFVPVDFLGVDEDGQKNIIQNIFLLEK